MGAVLFLSAKQSGTPPAPKPLPTAVRPLQASGVTNLFQLSSRIYSGSAPEGDAGFATLAALGIKTIISVDGAKPDVEAAARFGIRYVHLPFGYDGVPTNQAMRLVKAAETLPGPVFIHCHHGQHRGPAGAATVCMAMEGWSPEQATAWLKTAGTATNYAGLYRTVAQFHPPTIDELERVPTDFQPRVDVSPLATTMLEIDQRMDELTLIKEAGYRTPAAHPDLEPTHQSLLLHELFKELLRSPSTGKRSADFRAQLGRAESAAAALESGWSGSPVDAEKAGAAFKQMNNACSVCHQAFRN